MSMKTAKIMMKCIGTTLAICSAMTMAGGCIGSKAMCTKKSMKKTINKLADIIDDVL